MNPIKKYFLLLFILCFSTVFSQNIGINSTGSTPNPSAMLDVDVSALAAKKGLLIPRVTLAQLSAMNPLPAPAQGLIVYQIDGMQGFYYNTSTTTTPNWTYLLSANGATGGWGLNGNMGTTAGTNFLGTTDNADLVFKTWNYETMRVTASRKIGINESNPALSLQMRTYANGTIATPFDGIKITSPSQSNAYQSGAMFGIDDGTINGQMGTNAQLWNFENGFLRFGTNNTEDLRITSTGLFGMHESNPAATLTLRPYHNAVGGNIDGIQIVHPMLPANYLSGLWLGVEQMDGSSAHLMNYQNGFLNFGTNGIERMQITNTGSVAIGTTNAASTGLSTLVLQDNTGIRNGTMVLNPMLAPGTQGMHYGLDLNNPIHGRIWNYMNGDVEFGTNNTELMRLSSNGNIGIGTTTPSYKLDVNGSGKFNSLTIGNYTLPTFDGASGQVLQTNGMGSVTWTTPTASGTVSSVGLIMPSEFTVFNSPITSSGDINVSLASQSANKVFAGPPSGAATSPSFRSLVATDIPDLSSGYIKNQVIGNNFTTGQTASFDITGNGEVNGTLNVNGNVGIGTTAITTDEKLDLNGNMILENNSIIKIRNSGAASGKSDFIRASNGEVHFGNTNFSDNLNKMLFYLPTANSWTPNDGTIEFISPILGGTPLLHLNENGTIGVGINTPDELLDINGNTIYENNSIIKIRNSFTASGKSDFMHVSNGEVHFGNTSFSDNLSKMLFYLPTANSWTPNDGTIEFISPILGGTPLLHLNENGKMGIGTNSPTELLEVAGKVKIGNYTLPNTDGTAGQVLKTDGAGIVSWQNGSTGTVTSVALSMPSIFSVSGSPVTTSGTLTTTLATQSANTIFAGPSTGAAAAPTFRTLAAADIPTGATGYIQNNAVGTNFATGQAASFDITGNGEINGTLNVNGNVSIGNVNASTAKLRITSTNGSPLRLEGPVSGVGSTISQDFIDAAFGGMYASIMAKAEDFPTTKTSLIFLSGINTNVAGQAMIITGSGNVGVGNITPLNKLDIFGAQVIGTSYAGTNTAPANGLLVQGNTGIGTTNPGAKLEVAGQVKITGGAPGAGKVLVSDAVGLASWQTVAGVGGQWMLTGNAGTSAATNFIGTTDAIDFVFRTNNTEKMRVASGGNVGIGTTAPGEKLSVSGAESTLHGKAACISVSNTAAGGTNWYLRSGATGTATPAGGFSIANNAAYHMVIDGSGNMGIGCTAPAYKLHVIGDIASSATIRGVNAYVTGAITACSDVRYKKDFTSLDSSLAKILKTESFNYYWKQEEFPDKNFSNKKQIGFKAQEIRKLFPEIVFEDTDGYLSVDYSRLTPVLVEAIKEQQKIIDADKEKMKSMEAMMETLNKRISALEKTNELTAEVKK